MEELNIAPYSIAPYLVNNDIDIITLAHHGSYCKNNSMSFFKAIEPTVAVCALAMMAMHITIHTHR